MMPSKLFGCCCVCSQKCDVLSAFTHFQTELQKNTKLLTLNFHLQPIPESYLKKLSALSSSSVRLLMVNPYSGLNVMRLFNDAIHGVVDNQQSRVRHMPFAVFHMCVYVC